jgi:hypothetical protein
MFHVSRALFLPSFLETKQKPDVAGSPAHLSFISLVLSHMLAFLSLSHFTLFFLRLPRPLLPFSILITKAKDRKKKKRRKSDIFHDITPGTLFPTATKEADITIALNTTSYCLGQCSC